MKTKILLKTHRHCQKVIILPGAAPTTEGVVTSSRSGGNITAAFLKQLEEHDCYLALGVVELDNS